MDVLSCSSFTSQVELNVIQTTYKSDPVSVKYLELQSETVTGADERGAYSSHRNPDVTGCFYNIFNAVMTDTAY